MKTINLKLIGDVPLSTVKIDFAPNDYYITCSLKYNEKPKDRTLSDYISAQFNIQEIESSINLGYACIQFDSQVRFVSFDVYTNAERWTAATIKPVSASKGCIILADDSESGDGSYKEIYDKDQSCFALVWQDAVRWVQVADRLIVGLVPNANSENIDAFQLAEIRIFGIHHIIKN
jgi:hypothetical protein